jgi:hypothetical protein
MHDQQTETRLTTEAHPQQRLRAIGAAEQLLWLLDHTHPTHFAMVA